MKNFLLNGFKFLFLLLANAMVVILVWDMNKSTITDIQKFYYYVYFIVIMCIDCGVILYHTDESEPCRECGKQTEWTELCDNLHRQPYYEDICNKCWIEK